MASLSPDQKKELNKPRLRTMPLELFKGLGLHSTRFVFDKEVSLRRTKSIAAPKTSKRRMSRGADNRPSTHHSRRSSVPLTLPETTPVDSPCSWKPAGDSQAANRGLSKFVSSLEHYGLPSPVPADQRPKRPHTQHERNPFYSSRYGREAGESKRLPHGAPGGAWGSDSIAEPEEEEDTLEAARSAAAADAALQIGEYKRQAEERIAAKRFKDMQERTAKEQRKQQAQVELDQFEQRRAQSEAQGNLKMQSLRFSHRNEMMKQDTERCTAYKDNKMMKDAKWRIANLRKHAEWFEGTRRLELYAEEENFVASIAERDADITREHKAVQSEMNKLLLSRSRSSLE